jgi:hypothetical protein
MTKKVFLKVFQEVFSEPKYVALSLGISTLVFSFSVWLPNWRLIFAVFASPEVSFLEAISIVFSLFLSIGTNFTVLSATYTVTIAILFGVNIALLAYYMSARRGSLRTHGGALGVGGLVSGIFGIGCASCGTFILTSVLALVGAGGAVAFLPLGGGEFGILGVALIGYATLLIARKISEPAVCD